MHEFPYARPVAYGGAHARKPTEQVHMIEQRRPEARSRFGIILGNAGDDPGQIDQRPLGEEEAAIHVVAESAGWFIDV